MADRDINLNGETVQLKDVSAPGYVAPKTGYVIELNSNETRRFIKSGELDEIKELISSLVLEKDVLQYKIDRNKDQNVRWREEIDEITARVVSLRDERDKINAFLDEVER